MKKFIILLLIFIPTIALLYFSLQRNPRELPSALVGKQATPFELETLEGGKLSLEMAKGKPLILNFWSTWCGPCAAEHALLKKAHENLSPQGVVFYAILYEDTPENARKFISRNGGSVPILLDPELKTSIDYGVSGIPETFFINGQGEIRYKYSGALTPGILMENLSKILPKSGGNF